jgi:hypothetical protein
MRDLSVTQVLAIAGVADFSFCTDEGRWKGSETHRATELLDRGRLKKYPGHVAGRIRAYERFKVECHFVPDPDGIEVSCHNKALGIRGRADRIGKLEGLPAVLDLKNGPIQPAVKLQLCLYGEAIDPKRWWTRIAVELRDDGTYRAMKILRQMYWTDLTTARAAVRLAHWKMENGLYSLEK